MVYQLQRIQQLYCKIDTAWKFFSSPNNLSHITPKNMRFSLKTTLLDESIYEGMKIEYTISPLLRIPMRWTTRITEVNEKISFTDFQERGPYAYWNHIHEFFPNDKGVLMRDTVDYQLPLGFLGKIAYKVIVRKKLEHIFDYRYEVIEKIFNTKKSTK